MNARRDRRWILFAVVGSLLAILLGFVALPLSLPATTPLQVGPMHDYGATDVQKLSTGARAPARSPQPVPDLTAVPDGIRPHYDRLADRADWTGGAVVTCDISAFTPDNASPYWEGPDGELIASSATVDRDAGLDEGTVDLISRSSGVLKGRLTVVVSEPSGSSRVFLQQTGNDIPPGHIDGRWLQVRWSGAEPGSTTSCDGVWESETATLRITVVDHDGSPLPEDLELSEAVVILRGCGVMHHVRDAPSAFTIAASTCAVQLERRSALFPLIVARARPVRVSAAPGQTVDLTLRAPEEPPLYQPPDFVELGVIADAAAFEGSEQLTDFLDGVISDLAAGEWDPSASFVDDFRAAAEEREPADEPPEDDPDRPSSEEWRTYFSPPGTAAELDEHIHDDPDLVSSFAGMVHRGELRADELPPKTRAAVLDVLARRTP